MRYKLVVFDMDGTLTQHVSSWQLIHEKLGIWDSDAARYQELFNHGRISYRRFCELDAGHWRGIAAREIEKILYAVPYAKNVLSVSRKIKSLGLKTAIISTGLDLLAQKVKRELAIDYCVANKLKVRSGLLTGKVEIAISDGQKGKVFKKLLKKIGFKVTETIFVGDSATDITAAKSAGFSIAFNSVNKGLTEAVDYNCQSQDFSEVFKKICEIM